VLFVPSDGPPLLDATSGGVGAGARLGVGGRYELVEQIGAGGMGAVYRAIDHAQGCERAVKVLDASCSAVPVLVERFRREVTAAQRVVHPNVVSVLDVAAKGERPVFLVMELLAGETLSQLLKRTGPLPWARVRGYVDQIAAGLGAAHALGIVHRDVKPGNCFVLPDDRVKVLDFGIAKAVDAPAHSPITAAGEIVGTTSYMAPEQIRGYVDQRSDVYALGVVTFQLLTGRVPFADPDPNAVLEAHLGRPAPAPSSLVAGLPRGVDHLVLRMLAKPAHARFDGMGAVRQALASIEEAVAPADAWTDEESGWEDAPTLSMDLRALRGADIVPATSEETTQVVVPEVVRRRRPPPGTA
jgi:serine/threonine protein kinase